MDRRPVLTALIVGVCCGVANAEKFANLFTPPIRNSLMEAPT
jgi:hypothetical protein